MSAPSPRIIHVIESLTAGTSTFLVQATRELAASGPEPVREFLHRGRVGLAVETQ